MHDYTKTIKNTKHEETSSRFLEGNILKVTMANTHFPKENFLLFLKKIQIEKALQWTFILKANSRIGYSSLVSNVR